MKGTASERIETTIGELIETITDIALEQGSSEEESYALASMAIERILSRSDLSFEGPIQ